MSYQQMYDMSPYQLVLSPSDEELGSCMRIKINTPAQAHPAYIHGPNTAFVDTYDYSVIDPALAQLPGSTFNQSTFDYSVVNPELTQFPGPVFNHPIVQQVQLQAQAQTTATSPLLSMVSSNGTAAPATKANGEREKKQPGRRKANGDNKPAKKKKVPATGQHSAAPATATGPAVNRNGTIASPDTHTVFEYIKTPRARHLSTMPILRDIELRSGLRQDPINGMRSSYREASLGHCVGPEPAVSCQRCKDKLGAYPRHPEWCVLDCTRNRSHGNAYAGKMFFERVAGMVYFHRQILVLQNFDVNFQVEGIYDEWIAILFYLLARVGGSPFVPSNSRRIQRKLYFHYIDVAMDMAWLVHGGLRYRKHRKHRKQDHIVVSLSAMKTYETPSNPVGTHLDKIFSASKYSSAVMSRSPPDQAWLKHLYVVSRQ
ncbi:hypothetical protein DL98DRAFT_532238 [Cadophora sp. DSE1049]|nr:hypothetical protein DL98DRAFT_532238 [Cadophora sp. DSE1049]